MRKWILAIILILGLAEFGYGTWIPAKAWLSQILLERAWTESLETDQHHKPWPWADTWPVLRIQHEASNSDLLVLEGDSGQSLAFGPGRMHMSTMPGQPGNTVISGHRDTHFSFLKRVKPGEVIIVSDRNYNKYYYIIKAIDIVDSRHNKLLINSQDDRLTLATCYPFDALTAGGELRYIVSAIHTNEAKQAVK
ncbi:MAG: class GN sortase [Gammaproteobacteria bacterium]|nr:MAG: class GN sortase [Gammaproteobacteria bacterium]